MKKIKNKMSRKRCKGLRVGVRDRVNGVSMSSQMTSEAQLMTLRQTLAARFEM